MSSNAEQQLHINTQEHHAEGGSGAVQQNGNSLRCDPVVYRMQCISLQQERALAPSWKHLVLVLLTSVHHLSATPLSTSINCRNQQELAPFPLSSDGPQDPAAAASTWLKALAAATACSSSADGGLSDALSSTAR